jgi:hypothetical protein
MTTFFEASVKFKAAVERQVEVTVMHNDRHEMLKEEARKLATQARKEFRGISYASPVTGPDTTAVRAPYQMDKTTPEYQLGLVKAEFEAHTKAWEARGDDYSEEICQLKEEKQKLQDQISHVGVKHYQRKLDHAKELVVA